MTLFKTALLTTLLTTLPLTGPVTAQATSFDCSYGHSTAEKLICHNADLSKLDDELGKLYWKARSGVADKRSFRADSDAKWAWRETHCADEICLTSWYSGRIEELRQLVDTLQSFSRPSPPRKAREPAPLESRAAIGQCTAAEPGMVSLDECRTLMKSDMHWKYKEHGGDWFCGMAVLDQSKLPTVALQ
jgi:uncharacterized protein